jgi:hypothetical protein
VPYQAFQANDGYLSLASPTPSASACAKGWAAPISSKIRASRQTTPVATIARSSFHPENIFATNTVDHGSLCLDNDVRLAGSIP